MLSTQLSIEKRHFCYLCSDLSTAISTHVRMNLKNVGCNLASIQQFSKEDLYSYTNSN